MTADERIALFRKIAPEFNSLSDAEIQSNIDIYSDFINEKLFGSMYDKAVCFYTAHQISMMNVVADEGSESSYFNAGAITMEKEGDLQRQYAANSSSNSSDDMLNKTYYGKMYMQIAKMYRVPAMTRFTIL